MRTVIKIVGVEHRVSKRDARYTITHLLLDDGTEAQLFGTNIAPGDQVEVFYHYGKIKARKKPQKT